MATVGTQQGDGDDKSSISTVRTLKEPLKPPTANTRLSFNTARPALHRRVLISGPDCHLLVAGSYHSTLRIALGACPPTTRITYEYKWIKKKKKNYDN